MNVGDLKRELADAPDHWTVQVIDDALEPMGFEVINDIRNCENLHIRIDGPPSILRELREVERINDVLNIELEDLQAEHEELRQRTQHLVHLLETQRADPVDAALKALAEALDG